MPRFLYRALSSNAAIDTAKWGLKALIPAGVAVILSNYWQAFRCLSIMSQIGIVILVLFATIFLSLLAIIALQKWVYRVAMAGVEPLEEMREKGRALVEEMKERNLGVEEHGNRAQAWIEESENAVNQHAPNEYRMYCTHGDRHRILVGETKRDMLKIIIEGRVEKLRRIIGRKEDRAYSA